VLVVVVVHLLLVRMEQRLPVVMVERVLQTASPAPRSPMVGAEVVVH
jgi:hypothetical protein